MPAQNHTAAVAAISARFKKSFPDNRFNSDLAEALVLGLEDIDVITYGAAPQTQAISQDLRKLADEIGSGAAPVAPAAPPATTSPPATPATPAPAAAPVAPAA